MKLSVLGAGAVGAMLGGLVKRCRPEADVVFIARGEHAEAMRRQGGVVLRGFWGECLAPVEVTSDLAGIAGSDFVLLTVKSQASEETMVQAQPHLGSAVLVSVQNGINQRVLGRYVAPDRLFVGMTATNMALVEPGKVSLQRNGITVIGPVDGSTAEATIEKAVGAMRLSGLPMAANRNIVGVQYNKLLMNTMGYASVLSASNFVTEGVLCRPWRRALAMPILQEGLGVLDAAGIRLERTSGLSDVLRFRRLLGLFDLPLMDTVVRTALRQLTPKARIVYSVYQDLVRRRKTEIDFVNGEIVQLAQEHGRQAPLNALVVAMVRELEARGDGTFFSRDEVIRRFRAA